LARHANKPASAIRPMVKTGLSALLSDALENGADFAPTSQQREVNALDQQRLGDAAERFGQLLQQDVARFRQ
jgi:hypothetical protein